MRVLRLRLFAAVGLALLLASPGCKSGKATAGATPPVASLSAAPSASAGPVNPDAATGLSDAGGRTVYRAFRTKNASGVALEMRGDVVRVTYYDNCLVEFRGKATEGAHFSAREVGVGKLREPRVLTGALSADGQTLDATVTDPTTHVASTVIGHAGPFDGSEEKFTYSLKGQLGTRFIRMKIRREGTRLQGGYRYVRSAQDIGLVGTVSPGDGTFELTERVGDKVTGRFVGAIASISGALATWSSPDGSRTYPVVMEESWGDYPETIALGSGLTMYPQERQLTTDVCDVDVRYPQIRGAADKAAQAALNDLLRGERDKPRPCEAEVAPDDPEEAPPSRSFHEETYRLSTKTRGRFVGLEQSEFWYGAGAAHPNGGKTCSVLDTRTLTLVSLSDKLTLEGRAKLSEKVRAVFQGDSGDPGVGYIEASSIEVAPHTNICLTDTEIVVAFARYELGAYFLGEPEVPFPKAEVRPFFEKTDAMEALFSQ